MSDGENAHPSMRMNPLTYLKTVSRKKLMVLSGLAGVSLVLVGTAVFGHSKSLIATARWLRDTVLGIGPLLPSLFATGIGLVWLLWWLPRWQVNRTDALADEKRFDRENEARKTLAQVIGGALVLAGLYSSMQTLNLSREGQITDRFTKAIDQLGALDDKGRPKLEVRLGGIYALERIARDSERDHRVIMDILTTYVREHSPRKNGRDDEAPANSREESSPRIMADIQAVLNVLGRREVSFDEDRFIEDGLNLANTDLRKARFAGDFHHVHFDYSDLRGADFSGVNLVDAHLRSSDFRNANLRGATLGGYSTLDPDFDGADLRGTNVRGADLRFIRNLTPGQLSTATGDSATLLRFDMKRPSDWGR